MEKRSKEGRDGLGSAMVGMMSGRGLWVLVGVVIVLASLFLVLIADPITIPMDLEAPR